MMESPYTNPHAVDGVRVDASAPRSGQTVTGYGRKLPTRYALKMAGHWRRVYAMSYGNAASLYVIVRGVDHFLDTDTEHALDDARDAANGGV